MTREALRNDELLRLAVRAGRIGIFESDLERMRTWFSPELCSLLGLPIGTEMPYEAASQLIDERDRKRVQASIEAAANAADRGAWSTQCRITRADGAVRWVSILVRRIYRDTASGPQAVRSIGTVIDITQLNENEEALRESERRLRLALDAARMGTFESDITASTVRIDEQEARLLGLPEGTQTITADEIRTRIPPEDRQLSDARHARLRIHHEAYHHEFRLRMPDGTQRWLSAYADVKSNRIFGINLDITERKVAEAAFREGDTRLRVATAAAALGIFEWDPATDHAVWENDRMYEIFGRSRAEGPVNKQQFLDRYLHPDDLLSFQRALDKAMHRGRGFHIICRIKRNGILCWLQFDGKFERAGPEGAVRLIGVVADISARKRLKARARRLSDRLATIQERERRNMAQELHDSTVQHLVAANLAVMNLRQSKAKAQHLWDGLEASLGEAMKELRTLSFLLVPAEVQMHRFHECLRDYICGFSDRSGVAVELRGGAHADKLPLRAQRAIFRVVQEALANVYRHASASHVCVELRRIGLRLHLIVMDNGRGIRANGQHPRLREGVGIHGMRLRLKQIGGRLHISQPPGGGTKVHAVLPARLMHSSMRAPQENARSGDNRN
jgi:PAS domain S-box-containing protein